MTSALLVLFLAQACSIAGTTSKDEADHGPITSITHKYWTNQNIDDTNHKITQDEIYTENEFENINIHNFGSFGHKMDKFEMSKLRGNINEWGKVDSESGVSNLRGNINKWGKVDSESGVSKLRGKINKWGKVDYESGVRKFEEAVVKRVKRQNSDSRCDSFAYVETKGYITHPHKEKEPDLYYNNSDCTTVISVPDGYIIELTFVDRFRIENHPECAYDYLEIRDGDKGYSDLLGKVCGQAFPRVMTTKGPYAWLKFHSDDTIEYEGFNIQVKRIQDPTSYSIPTACYEELEEATSGIVSSDNINDKCLEGSENHGLDVLWKIQTPENTKIFLNFTRYELQKPNECDQNGIQVFGSVLELSAKLEYYCGSVANPVISKDEMGNVMHIRLYVSKSAREKGNTKFEAKYTAFRTTDPSKESDACTAAEFDCADNTCIDIGLKCDQYANCRLKTDEDDDNCKEESESPIKQVHIIVILVIFSLILSAMTFVFLFKCIRKLYQDHKIIKEHIRQSCEDRLDRLDSLVGSRLTLDAKRLQRDSEPRASLERENHANEMYKRKRDSFSKRKPTSIDSDFQETHLDLDEEVWRREVDTHIEPEDIMIEQNGRSRHDKRKDSVRSKRGSEERKEIRDASVGAPDTKESGCQTRESLFQTDPPPSSDGKSSSSNSRGFSTFGYSGATIVRPSPPTNTSEITIELLKQVPRQDSVKPQKKTDRRPMSTETTRSAPDVIIVSKPIR